MALTKSPASSAPKTRRTRGATTAAEGAPVTAPAGTSSPVAAASAETAAINAAVAAAQPHESVAASLARGVADPAAAQALTSASGALDEPEVLQAVDLSHESVDNNPRKGTSAQQNAVDWNDAGGRRPDDPAFAGQGLDLSAYGKQG